VDISVEEWTSNLRSHNSGHKEDAIHDLLGMKSTRDYHRLIRHMGTETPLAHNPLTAFVGFVQQTAADHDGVALTSSS
jgi:hypothetical protein